VKRKTLLVLLVLVLVLSSVVAACAAPAPAPTATTTATKTTTATATTTSTVTAPAATVTKTAEVAAPTAELPIVKWAFASRDAWNHFATIHLQKMVDNIVERTDGRFQITHYPAGELGIEFADQPAACAEGSLEMATMATGISAGTFPWLDVMGRPMMAEWPDGFYAVAEAVQPIMEREFGKLGITPIGFYTLDPVSLWITDEVADIKDTGGIKVRCWSESVMRVAEAIGAEGIVMSYYDVYVGVQRGTIDGLFTGSAGLLGISGQELLKHGYLMGLPPGCDYIMVNDEAFASLPYEYQAILLEEVEKFEKSHYSTLHEDFAAVNAKILDAGVTLHELSSEDRRVIAGKLMPMWQEWADAGGPVAQEMLDIALETLGY